MAEWLAAQLADPNRALLVGIVGGIVFAAVVSFLAHEASAWLEYWRVGRRERKARERQHQERMCRDTLQMLPEFERFVLRYLTAPRNGAPVEWDHNRWPDASVRVVGDTALLRAWLQAQEMFLGRQQGGGISAEEYKRFSGLNGRMVETVSDQLETVISGKGLNRVPRQAIADLASTERVIDAAIDGAKAK